VASCRERAYENLDFMKGEECFSSVDDFIKINYIDNSSAYHSLITMNLC